MEIHRKDGEIETRPVSKGGRLFDWITYGGLAGIVTFIITVPIANVLDRGARFGRFHEWISNGVQKLGGGPKFSETVAETTRFMQGGNLMLIPVGIMENFRTPIVKGFNRLLNDPTDPKSIEDAPPQTLGSIIKGRAVAWGMVFTGLLGMNKMFPEQFTSFKEGFAELTCKVFRKPTHLPSGEFSKTYKAGKAGAIDLFATATAASLLYVGSHFFARQSYEKKAEKAYIKRKEQSTQPGDDKAPDIAVKQDDTAAEKPANTITKAQREESVLQAPAPQHEQPTAAL